MPTAGGSETRQEDIGIAGHINIAVLGDLHGHFALAYRLLVRWQRERGEATISMMHST